MVCPKNGYETTKSAGSCAAPSRSCPYGLLRISKPSALSATTHHASISQLARERLFWLYKIRNKNCRMPSYLHDLVAFQGTSVGYNLRRSQHIEATARLKVGENSIAWRFRFPFSKLSEDAWNLNFPAFRAKIQTLLQDGFFD